MNHHKLLGLGVTLVLMAGCQDSPIEPTALQPDAMFGVVGSNPVVGHAAGSGHAPCSPASVSRCLTPGPLRTFSFNAQVRADGTVHGRAQAHNRGNGNKLKADIDCLNFFGVEQNRAWMIATVTHSNTDDIPEGAVIGFAVADNGEGAAADPDQITGFGISPPPITALICSGSDNNLDFFFDNVFAFDAVKGNIQVQAPEAS